MHHRPARLSPFELQRQVRCEAVRMLAHHSRYGLLAGLAGILVALAWLHLHDLMSASTLSLWGSAMLLATAGALILHRQALPADGMANDPRRMERLFGIKNFVGGALWGVLPVLGPYHQGPAAQTVVCILLAAVTLAATGLNAPSLIAFGTFTVAALGPVAVLLFLDPPEGFPMAGLAVLSFAAVLAALHRLFNDGITHSLAGRIQSDTLAEEQELILDGMAEAVVLSRKGCIVKANRQFARLVGLPQHTLLRQPLRTWLADPADWSHRKGAAIEALTSCKTFRFQTRLRRADGYRIEVEISAQAVDPADLAKGVVWLGCELTERLQHEVDLRTSEARYRELITLTSDWYWEWDTSSRFRLLSGGGLDRAGLRQGASLGQTLWDLPQVYGVTPQRWQQLQQCLAARQPFRDFVWERHATDGAVQWFTMSGNPTFDAAGQFLGYHGIGAEITEHMRGVMRFRQLAYHDMLTGLPNRRLVMDRLELAMVQASRRGRSLAVLMLDLDGFKAINDTAGHATGDQVLTTTAQRLRQAVRTGDTVARLGGDEFLILMPEVDHPNDAMVVADKVVAAVGAPLTVDDGRFMLGVSVGLAFYPEDGAGIAELLDRADVSMYAAKRTGGSRHLRLVRPLPGTGMPESSSARRAIEKFVAVPQSR